MKTNKYGQNLEHFTAALKSECEFHREPMPESQHIAWRFDMGDSVDVVCRDQMFARSPSLAIEHDEIDAESR